MKPLPEITARELLAAYDGLLLDSYGVLVDSDGAIAHAVAFVRHLEEVGVPYVVVSNDASRTSASSAARFHDLGLPIDARRIVTSGSLIGAHFDRHGLRGKRAIVLGPADSEAYVRDAGGVIVPPTDGEAEVLVICDDAGYPFVATIEQVLKVLFANFDRGRSMALVLPNPDLVYPKGDGLIGLTAGSVAAVIEGALARRYPGRPPRFAALGKPHRPLFDAAVARLGLEAGAKLCMLGDQLATDIEGARNAGLDAALVGTGLTSPDADLGDAAKPAWRLRDLSLTTPSP